MNLESASLPRAPRSLMWKTVSEDCNLACDYCYYSTCKGTPGRKIRTIDRDLLETVIRQMMEAGAGGVSFVWQGGEPLLAGLSFFEQVVSFQARYALPNTVISNAVQTNGTLVDKAWAAFFKRYSFLLGVSVDGPRTIHDKRRITGSGAGSYNRVMTGIEELGQASVPYNILTVLHEDNIERPGEIMSWMTENDFSHIQFIPCMDFRSQDAATEGRYLISPRQYGHFLCEVFDIWYGDGDPTLSIRFFDNWLHKLVGLEPELCTHRSTCSSMLVLEQNGDAYPCDFYLDAEHRLGNMRTDTLQQLMTREKWGSFIQAKSRVSDRCLQCRFLHYCQGGCPRNRVGSESAHVAGVDYFCESYSLVYSYGEERMRKLATKVLRREGVKRPPRNAPCLCGSGKKSKVCCGV
ncbi:anaerobic sulfatase maturase [Paenibacillus jiagnxiensis]|uniref:anaerobic sulfatase maturase n=1 Tax=Paenibacillus jiagnxiensis TaxID=3228926 RepID=UPI0033B8E5E9